MLSAPTIKHRTILDFETSVFKKDKISMAGHDEVAVLLLTEVARFVEYAAAGTVKQNYINILLILLRLRQACDHPLLMSGSCSNFMCTSSIEMAKKLTPEKQVSLLNCLEASLGICGICNDRFEKLRAQRIVELQAARGDPEPLDSIIPPPEISLSQDEEAALWVTSQDPSNSTANRYRVFGLPRIPVVGLFRCSQNSHMHASARGPQVI